MTKLFLKLFGLSTVVLFFTASVFFILFFSGPLPIQINDDIEFYMFPAAKENLSIKFHNLLTGLRKDKIKQKFTMSELEFNASIYPLIQKNKIATYNPWIFFLPNKIRFQFYIPLDDILVLVSNRVAKTSINKTVKTILKKPGRLSTKIFARLDIELFWEEDKLVFNISQIKFGMLPVPISKFIPPPKYLNASINKYISKLREHDFLLRKIVVKDKEMIFFVESAVTDKTVKKTPQQEFFEKHPELSYIMQQGSCKFGCSKKDKKILDDYVNFISKQDIQEFKVRKQDIERLRRLEH